MPTVQISSAIISAIQVQEAIKLICDQQPSVGKSIYYQGKINDFDVLTIPVNEKCMVHSTYSDIISIPLSSQAKLKDFLNFVSHPDYAGEGATLDFRADRTFVHTVACRFCGNDILFNKPSFKIYDTETVCVDCRERGVSLDKVDADKKSVKTTLSEFNLTHSDEIVLNMSLQELGVPLLHVVAVLDNECNYSYFELSDDKPALLPHFMDNPIY